MRRKREVVKLQWGDFGGAKVAVGKRRDGTRLAATGRDWLEPGQMTEMESGNSGAGVVNAPGGQGR